MPIQIYWKFYQQKNENLQIKKNSDIFYISAQNIDCGYSLEPPRRGGSNEYPQSMVLSRNKKTNVYPCKPQFYYIKVGFKGVKIIKACFRDEFCICFLNNYEYGIEQHFIFRPMCWYISTNGMIRIYCLCQRDYLENKRRHVTWKWLFVLMRTIKANKRILAYILVGWSVRTIAIRVLAIRML